MSFFYKNFAWKTLKIFHFLDDVELRFKGNDAYVQNIAYNTVPLIIHGNGPSKLLLNSMGNYIAKAWSPDDGCLHCWDGIIELDLDNPRTQPKILVALFVTKPTPFLEEFFEKIYLQRYAKKRIDMFVYNSVEYHGEMVKNFLDRVEGEYKSVKQIMPNDEISEMEARDLAM